MMNYTRSKTPSMGTPSVYSHVTGRSSAGLKSARSLKSLKIPWYRKAILQDAIVLDIQRGSMFMAFYSVFLCFFTIATAIFDLYCYGMAVPGSTHYGYFIMSFEFIYVGNTHVRNTLIVMALFSLISAAATLVASVILIFALRKEHEQKIIPWLWAFAIFTLIRLLAFLFFSIVNDLYFGYNTTMCVLWSIFIVINVYGWVLVYSLFIELSNLSKLADIAQLRSGEMPHTAENERCRESLSLHRSAEGAEADCNKSAVPLP